MAVLHQKESFEALVELAGGELSAGRTPALLRKYIRESYAVGLIDMLAGIAAGTVTSQALDKDGNVVELQADMNTRRAAATDALKLVLGTTTNLELGDDLKRGILALPEADMARAREIQRGTMLGLPPPTAGSPPAAVLEDVEVEEMIVPTEAYLAAQEGDGEA